MTLSLKRSFCLAAFAASCLAAPAGEPPAGDAWRFSVSLGVRDEPQYPGSGSRTTLPLAMFSGNYGRYFVGLVPGAGLPVGVGVDLLRAPAWHVGIGVGGEVRKPRKESDSARLRGLGDVDGTELGSLFAGYRLGWLELHGAVLADLGGKGQGTRVVLDLTGRFSPFQGLVLSAGPGCTWANGEYNQTFFGIDGAQSERSGLPSYRPGAGVDSVRFEVGADYRLSPGWSLGLHGTAARLRGDAASSFIVENKEQNSYGLSVTHRF